MSSSSDSNEKCDHCRTTYTFMKRKKTCGICQQYFCSTCAPRIRRADQSYRFCLICQTISNPLTPNEQLMNLKVKHLRSFLDAKKIPHSTCKEKNDLIELIRRHQTMPFVNIENRPNPSSINFQQTFSTFADQFNHFATNLFGNINEPSGEPVNQSSNYQHRNTNFQPTTTTIPQTPHEPRAHATAAPPHEPRTHATAAPPHEPRTHATAAPPHEPRAHANATPSNESQSTPNQPTRPRRKSLGEITSEASIEDLSSRELKEILAANFVDFKGCVEKLELIEKVRRLYRDQQNARIKAQNVDLAGNGDSDLCKICLDATADCVFLDCAHMVACARCGKLLAECPICRAYIVRVIHVFKS